MSFDRLAPHYRWMERVLAGRLMQRARAAWLDRVKGLRQALLVGEGPGRFLEAALVAMPEARFVVVDASAAMLEVAASRVRSWDRPRVRFEHGALPGWTGDPGAFDLVATHFFLDCFGREDLAGVIAALDRAAAPAASWLLTDFGLPDAGWARRRARLIHALMYLVFRPLTGIGARSLVPPEEGLLVRGWRRDAQREWSCGLIRSSHWRRG